MAALTLCYSWNHMGKCTHLIGTQEEDIKCYQIIFCWSYSIWVAKSNSVRLYVSFFSPQVKVCYLKAINNLFNLFRNLRTRKKLNLIPCADSNSKKWTCRVSHLMCHMSCVKCCMSHLMCHMSCFTCHVSHVMCCMSPITCHLSPVNIHSHRPSSC